jgi:heme-degrading monooxygenase HmoA
MTVAVIFTSTRSDGHDAEYESMSEHMAELARQQPGFVRMSSVRDPRTREGITVAWFEDEESVRAWKRHPEHVLAQQRGISDLYEEYTVSVAVVEREYAGPR